MIFILLLISSMPQLSFARMCGMMSTSTMTAMDDNSPSCSCDCHASDMNTLPHLLAPHLTSPIFNVERASNIVLIHINHPAYTHLAIEPPTHPPSHT